MHSRESKLEKRIARRKEKVQRMIGEQETRISALNSVTFLRQEDCRRALDQARNKLYRLKQELQALESGNLQWRE